MKYNSVIASLAVSPRFPVIMRRFRSERFFVICENFTLYVLSLCFRPNTFENYRIANFVGLYFDNFSPPSVFGVHQLFHTDINSGTAGIVYPFGSGDIERILGFS